MELSDVLLQLGEDSFNQLIRSVSIGKLRTYQVYERFKVRAHLAKLNTESLRKAAPRLWARISERDEEFAKDLAQALLVSHIGMVRAVLDFLGIPHEDGFFAKDIDPAPHLTDGWQQRVWEKFRGDHPTPALLLYINHLAWELTENPELFIPAA